MDLSITRADHGDRTVVRLGGEIDVYTAPFVREKLDEQIHAGRADLVVDLSDVTFLDSTGLGVLVGRLKIARTRGGSLRLVGTAERVLRVFAITGLDKVLHHTWKMAKPGRVTVRFGEPLHLGGNDYEGLARQVEEAVRSL